jgi:drug/metabolite transporter (DMT)-like permease
VLLQRATTSPDSNESQLTSPDESRIPSPESRVPSPESQVSHPKSRAYAAWVTVCLVWGTTYLAIRIALESIPPLLMGGIRYVIAGLTLATILAVRGERLPRPRQWPYLAVLGTLLIGFGNGGVVWAEQTVPSGLTAVLVATSPFWMTGIDAMLPHGERLTLGRIIGLVVGFCGIVMLVWPEIHLDARGRGFLGGVIASQFACIGWAIGSSYSRRRGHVSAKDENVLATAAFEMFFGGTALFIAATVHRELGALAFTPRTASALAYLIVFGAVVGFAAYAYALKHLRVATVSLYAYINPVIAVLLGTLLLHEPFSARTVLGASVVFAGVVLVKAR